MADDPGRQIRKPWLGPKGLRWPMDWTFEEWGLAFFVLLAGLALIIFAVPAGIVIAVATWRAATVISKRISPETPNATFWLFSLSVAGVCLMLSPHLTTWIKPLWFPVAVLVALLLPIYAVRRVGNVINWNRPVAYWLRLPIIVARGPRREGVIDINPSALMIEATDRSTDLEPVAKPTVTASPKRGDVEFRTVPLNELAPPVKRAPRHKLVERTAEGFRVGGTEYRIERTF